MKHAGRLTTLAVATLVAAAAAAPVGRSLPASQSPPQEAGRQQPAFRTAANYVRVDAYPTAKGQIVPDLTQADFEILEDGVPQKIDAFERVTFRPPAPESVRRELGTVAESNDAAADPRNRAFVLFLDSYHTSVDATTIWVTGGVNAGNELGGVGSQKSGKAGKADSRIGRALAKFLEGLIGPDDVIAVTRPEMSAASLAFRRRPASFEEFLLTGGLWQRLDLDRDMDQTERMYFSCYSGDQPGTATEMIARRREHMVIDTLHNLVLHLQTVRDGRKALLVVSEGWTLFKPSRQLATGTTSGRSSVGGRLVGGQTAAAERQACERDRQMLAELDNEREFVEMLDDANRSNVTFYPIDPRGLAVFNDRTSTAPGNRMFKGQLDSLRTLATATDGVASLNSNDFAKSFKRIADDLGSYYLMGYYSTNGAADGKFRRITVRVKRPGVDVRARRGYRAATKAELEARARESAAAPKAGPAPLTVALGELGAVRLDAPVRVRTGYGWRVSPSGEVGASVWVVGEIDSASARQAEWQAGGAATITLSSASGETIASVEQRLSTASRNFMVLVPPGQSLAAGDYVVNVLWHGPSLPASESLRLTIPPIGPAPGPLPGRPLLWRRGPYSGVTYQPTADPRYRRQERLRVDVPVAGANGESTARLLDRAGRPLAVPITLGRREDGGLVWVTAELTLAPLAVGEYVVELTIMTAAGPHPILTAFRIVP